MLFVSLNQSDYFVNVVSVRRGGKIVEHLLRNSLVIINISLNSIQMSQEKTPTKIIKEKGGKPDSIWKKRTDNLWKVMLIALTFAGAVLFKKVYSFQTEEQYKDIRCGNLSDMIIYGLSIAVLYTCMDLLIHYLFDDLCQKYYITAQRYTQPEQRKKRCYTLVKWGYSMIYYLASSIWAYKIIRETSFMPTWLGGFGSPFTLLDHFPRIPEATFEMKAFYIIQFGKHFSRFFAHMFIRPEGNFFQYALHHGLSVFLIIFSYLSNQWLIGIFVLLVHDYSDFALTLGRSYRDSRYKYKPLDILYAHAFFSWVTLRIFVFSYCCIYASICSLQAMTMKMSAGEMDLFYFGCVFMVCMMCGLEVMHLYWTYYIMESFISVKISPKIASHTYD